MRQVRESGPGTAGECVKAGDDRCFCQRSNSGRFVGAAQMPPPFLSTGPDVGITRQEQSSQQRSDHTGTLLHPVRGGVG